MTALYQWPTNWCQTIKSKDTVVDWLILYQRLVLVIVPYKSDVVVVVGMNMV